KMIQHLNKEGGKPMPQTNEELLGFLRRLRAVKEYTSEPVSDAAVEQILEVGRWSGSGGNPQPGDVGGGGDPEPKRKMGDWGARPAATAGVVLLVVMQNENPSLDEGRLAERLCLGAAAVGLASTVATLKNEGPAQAKELLGIPPERRAVCVVAIGHTDREA